MERCIKAVLALILLLAMFGLAACGNPETPAAAPTAEQAQAQATPAPATGGETQPAEEPASPMEVIEINMVHMISGRPVPPGQQAVDDAINEIAAQYGVRIDRTIVEMGVYSQQVSMMLTAREPIDLVQILPFGPTSFAVTVPQGHFQPMNSLLERYGQGVLDTLGPLIQGTTVGGNIYTVSGYRSLVQNVYKAFRLDTLEELGLVDAAKNIRTLADLEAIYQAVLDNTNLVPLVAGADGNVMTFRSSAIANEFANWTNFDDLGDTLQLVRVTPDNRVINHFASDEFRLAMETIRRWYEMGFVYRDAAIATLHSTEYIANNVGFSYFAITEVGGDAAHSALAGTPLLFVYVGPGPQVTTGFTRGFNWGIPSASREPEAAARFLNLMFTNAEIANLLAWGLEGRDYVLTPDGIAEFPPGVASDTVLYQVNDFLFGNQFLKHPWYGSDPNLRELAEQEMIDLGPSPFLGFAAELDDLQMEIMAVQGVIDQFRRQITSGAVPLTVYEEFLVRLEQVGANDIIEEYQRQLDEWLANR